MILQIVSCTRERDINNTQLGQSLQRFKHLPFIQTTIFPGNEEGICKRYNEAISFSMETPSIMVFVHDDVQITDNFWFDRIIQATEKYDLVGVAGNTRRLPKASSWACIDENGTLDDQRYFSGIVARADGSWDVFAESNKACELLDGVLLATKSETLKRHNIRFDEQFKFHHYDMDISRQFRQKGLTVGTAPISITHHSGGGIGPQWKESYNDYIAKWKE